MAKKRIIIDELEFAVPYGKIKAKTWHEETEDCKRVLALHGWMDNAGSFDKIVQHLEHPKGLYVVAPDLPGHGLSSQIPEGCSYDDWLLLIGVRRVVKHLEWDKRSYDNSNNKKEEQDKKFKKFTIMAHSLGAMLGLFYAGLYPDEIEQLILLDSYKTRTQDSRGFLSTVAQTIDDYLDLEQSRTESSGGSRGQDKGSVVVSYEAAIVGTIDGHAALGKLSREDVVYLLKRSTVAVSSPPNSVIYTRDLRLQAMINIREHLYMNLLMFQGGKSHFVSILGTDGFYSGKVKSFVNDIIELKKVAKECFASYNVCWVEGDHYIHITKAQQIANIVNEAIKDPKSFKSDDDMIIGGYINKANIMQSSCNGNISGIES